MNRQELQHMISVIAGLKNMILRVLHEDTVQFSIPVFSESIDSARAFYSKLLIKKDSPVLLVTDNHICYGSIYLKEFDDFLVIGPSISIKPDEALLRSIMKESNIPASMLSQFGMFINASEPMTVEQFAGLLSLLEYTMNRTIVSIDDILIEDGVPKQQDLLTEVEQQHTSSRYEQHENEMSHNTYLQECYCLSLVMTGNLQALNAYLDTPVSGTYGKIATNPLRQSQNIFIATTTQITRAAIQGGLDIETAYNLSDIYIQKSEQLSSEAAVRRLEKQMILDFAARVANVLIYNGVSEPIAQAKQYVRDHINQPLQAQDLANEVGLSTSYFLKRFKQEVGMGVNQYITNEKITEAILLLTYTDKSLSEISNYLYFSSQSYFQNVFKKATGMTPGVFRKQRIKPGIVTLRTQTP